jgi:hypothetical protein
MGDSISRTALDSAVADEGNGDGEALLAMLIARGATSVDVRMLFTPGMDGLSFGDRLERLLSAPGEDLAAGED